MKMASAKLMTTIGIVPPGLRNHLALLRAVARTAVVMPVLSAKHTVTTGIVHLESKSRPHLLQQMVLMMTVMMTLLASARLMAIIGTAPLVLKSLPLLRFLMAIQIMRTAANVKPTVIIGIALMESKSPLHPRMSTILLMTRAKSAKLMVTTGTVLRELKSRLLHLLLIMLLGPMRILSAKLTVITGTAQKVFRSRLRLLRAPHQPKLATFPIHLPSLVVQLLWTRYARVQSRSHVLQ